MGLKDYLKGVEELQPDSLITVVNIKGRYPNDILELTYKEQSGSLRCVKRQISREDSGGVSIKDGAILYEAQTILDEAIRLNPRNADAWDNKARIYRYRYMNAEADAALARAGDLRMSG